MYVRNCLGVINCVRTVVIGSITVRIGNAGKYKCDTLNDAVRITVKLYMFTVKNV